MRLLRTRTLHLEPFDDCETRPRYAVLSHTWGPSYPGLTHPTADSEQLIPASGSDVIRRACHEAAKLGFEYLWAESICVDRSSVEEVDEAINSAFQWFQQAGACLVYLSDLPPAGPPNDEASHDENSWRQCAWWTRAWTLPELLAPSDVRFYDADWNFRGAKTSPSLVNIISRITHISQAILCDRSLVGRVSVAKRMSWAANRQASRVEDRAYSLLGIFGVRMQVNYGEGATSFLRLQEKILRQTGDMTLLAWEAQPSERPYRGLLASSPDEFARFVRCPLPWLTPLSLNGKIENTDQGFSITAQFFPYNNVPQALLLDLGTQHEGQRTVLMLFRYKDYYVRPASNAVALLPDSWQSVARSVLIPKDIDALTSRIIDDTGQLPIFSNGRLTLPSAEKTPGQHVPLAALLRRGAPNPAVLARHRGDGSTAESSDTTYVTSCHAASSSFASMSPMFAASSLGKRGVPPDAFADREDKRARTRSVRRQIAIPPRPGSEATVLRDGESDDSGEESVKTTSSDAGDLSDSEGAAAPSPPPLVDADHPFLAVADELAKEARAKFTTWLREPEVPREATTYLECPFHRRDPDRYALCSKRAAMRTARDVRQHLVREHRPPDCCPVCYELFPTGSAADAHVMKRTCKRRPRPELEGISKKQMRTLARGDDRPDASREEQWRDVWRVVFPGEEPPASPFPDGGGGAQLIGLAREFWDERGQLVVSGFLERKGLLGWEVRDEERGLAALHALVLQRLVDAIHEEEKWEVVQRGSVPPPPLHMPRGNSVLAGLLASTGVSLGVPFRALPFADPRLPLRRRQGARRARSLSR